LATAAPAVGAAAAQLAHSKTSEHFVSLAGEGVVVVCVDVGVVDGGQRGLKINVIIYYVSILIFT